MTESKPSKVGLKRQALTEPGTDGCELMVKKSMMDSLEDSFTESFEAIAVQPGPSTSRQTMTNAECWSKFKANLSEEKKAELREKDRKPHSPQLRTQHSTSPLRVIWQN